MLAALSFLLSNKKKSLHSKDGRARKPPFRKICVQQFPKCRRFKCLLTIHITRYISVSVILTRNNRITFSLHASQEWRGLQRSQRSRCPRGQTHSNYRHYVMKGPAGSSQRNQLKTTVPSPTPKRDRFDGSIASSHTHPQTVPLVPK